MRPPSSKQWREARHPGGKSTYNQGVCLCSGSHANNEISNKTSDSCCPLSNRCESSVLLQHYSTLLFNKPYHYLTQAFSLVLESVDLCLFLFIPRSTLSFYTAAYSLGCNQSNSALLLQWLTLLSLSMHFFSTIVISVLVALSAAANTQDLVSQIPACAKTCLNNAAKNAGCDVSDIKCQCEKLIQMTGDARPCISSGCSVDDTSSMLHLTRN